ncbi:MAG: 30S ribosomal protein S20 [Bdellovibrionales bacterium]|nr:30S ribosomal protein S20 [Bdellovibrionales bacterium]
MANHKSALKRIRQNEKTRDGNRFVRATVRSAIKKTRAAIQAKDKEQATTLFAEAEKAIQKAAGAGLYHKNNASRKVSRLAQAVQAIS